MIFSLAIVNWNTKDHLDACLASIFSNVGTHQVEVLVADNASRDGSAEMVAAKYPQVELVRNASNVGFARGHEALLAKAHGDVLVLVNSDVRMLANCLDAVELRFAKDPTIGVVGCRILGPDGEIQPSCRRYPTLWRQFCQASGLARVWPRCRLFGRYLMGDFDHQHSREVDQVMGSFFAIRRRLIDEIGFLDTQFFMYYEEVDFCRRTTKAGYRVFFEADSAVWHEGGASANKVRILTIRRTIRSMRRYFEKHHGPWTWLPLVAIVSLDAATHTAYAWFTRRGPLTTFRAYGLGLWDVVCRRKACF